jgi:predicted component of type VI protein secretion system
MEYVLDQRRVSIGRGPGVDLALEDPSLVGHHAIFEFCDGGFSLKKMSEEARISVNGCSMETAVLKAEDRFQLGGLSFSYLVEPRFSF